MVFSSNIFLFVYLPIVLVVYFFLRKRSKLRNYWLLFASMIFYAWNQPNYLWIIIFSIVINYFGGILITKARTHNIKMIAVTFTIGLDLACLFYYKYFNMFVDILERISHRRFSFVDVILPIGISFFTFQSMSYVFDVYRDKVVVQKNIFKLALYIVLFPQLIAGPIVRYSDIADEIDERVIAFDDLIFGIKCFTIGLFKKVVIANAMAATADAIWSISPTENTVAVAWLGIVTYTLQIYFDFSGYSEMAIGLGRMFGFHFCENFNFPYISKSISEFWRRWHMSLSGWFRDYVYIPLGGNRKHVYLNLAIVFLLTGIWHGANYTFIFWGVWHGFFVIVERLVANRNSKGESDSLWIRVLSHTYTMMVVMIGWVFFRADSLSQGILYVKSLFGMLHDITPGFELGWYLDRYTICILVVAILWSTPIWRELKGKLAGILDKNVYTILGNIGIILMFGYSVIRVVSSTYNPFIYFQF